MTKKCCKFDLLLFIVCEILGDKNLISPSFVQLY